MRGAVGVRRRRAVGLGGVLLIAFWSTGLLCRVPPRQAGNFHLRPQMKVTKAKRLNATPLSSFFAPRTLGPAGHLEPPPQTEATVRSKRPRCALARGPANLRGRGFARPAPSSALQVRCVARLPSGPPGRGSAACRTHERCCVEGLCFGDFHLAPQMKVTRSPGRDPAKQRSQTNHQIAPAMNDQRTPRCRPTHHTIASDPGSTHDRRHGVSITSATARRGVGGRASVG